MKNNIESIKVYFAQTGRKELFIGIAVVLAMLCVIVAIIFAVHRSGPKFDYDPANACGMLTKNKANELLGDDVLHDDRNDNKLSLSGNTASSKCSYTDANPQLDDMKVIAVAVRSGINDEGVAQNRSAFAQAKSAANTQVVNNIGDDAFYAQRTGQLNILSGREWFIVSSGAGSDASKNTLDGALSVAYKLTPTLSVLPSF